MDKNQLRNDHDLLIELRTEVGNIRKDIQGLNDNLVKRVGDLELHTATKLELEKASTLLKDDYRMELTTTSNAIRQEVDLKMITQNAETARISKIVYGACALILTGFLGTVAVLVWK